MPTSVNFGDFELIKKIGQGCCGEIFRAIKSGLSRIDALKRFYKCYRINYQI